ncbi:MAG: Rne/Rng family ribonuclease [Alphaproteobacteria bacterium]
MSEELLINVAAGETRAAIVDDGALSEVVIERLGSESEIGRIYLGRVRRLMPGMEAAFVDIGTERAGFLPLRPPRGDSAEAAPAAPTEGEELCVQITRDMVGRKGAQLSRRLSLAGRLVVLMPGGDGVSVSRMIGDEAERERLIGIMSGIAGTNERFIMRTAAEGAKAEELEADAEYLRASLQALETARDEAAPPTLLHAELAPLERILRDHANERMASIRIDDGAALASAREFCRRFMPGVEKLLALHDGPAPLFDLSGVDDAIEEALDSHVWLPSGAGIVIEQTEAFTAIDVNSGAATSQSGAEAAALAVNLEAAGEVARQLRLRNIGGLVVVDFIDMEQDESWQQLVEAAQAATARDRTPVRVLGRTEAGLVEITRRRRRPSLAQSLGESCPQCDGLGWVKTIATVTSEVQRALYRQTHQFPAGTLVVCASPEMVDALEDDSGAAALDSIESAIGRRIELRAEPERDREAFDIVPD